MKKLLSLSLMLSLGLATITPALNAAQSQTNSANVSGWQAAKKWWLSGRKRKALNVQERRAFRNLKKNFAIGTIIAVVATIIGGGVAVAHRKKPQKEIPVQPLQEEIPVQPFPERQPAIIPPVANILITEYGQLTEENPAKRLAIMSQQYPFESTISDFNEIIRLLPADSTGYSWKDLIFHLIKLESPRSIKTAIELAKKKYKLNNYEILLAIGKYLTQKETGMTLQEAIKLQLAL